MHTLCLYSFKVTELKTDHRALVFVGKERKTTYTEYGYGINKSWVSGYGKRMLLEEADDNQ